LSQPQSLPSPLPTLTNGIPWLPQTIFLVIVPSRHFFSSYYPWVHLGHRNVGIYTRPKGLSITPPSCLLSFLISQVAPISFLPT
jgi:hypothetical protein